MREGVTIERIQQLVDIDNLDPVTLSYLDYQAFSFQNYLVRCKKKKTVSGDNRIYFELEDLEGRVVIRGCSITKLDLIAGFEEFHSAQKRR
ncbi:hypothetical protein JCM19231_1514 [Vibrio ishigakensis]|uniref:Uncharacterized protein n=1 Tax=Vibrio ishigakensis TaxID=1481914 RepID=A0A0B8P2N4_9VIBR|nr:hypothetical protein JCM19231_1514 [Vibrio ishigakensis]